MNKDVMISIKGLQFDINKTEAVEVVSVGKYFLKNGKHYILYEELAEEQGVEEVTQNTIKISHNQIDILKRGANNIHMIFERNRKNMTYYKTPIGNLLISIDTARIQLDVEEDQLMLKLDYGLEVNYTFVSDCNIEIHVVSRNIRL